MDCSPPGSPVCGIFQARILNGLPFPSSGDFPTQGPIQGLLHSRQILYHWSHLGSPNSSKRETKSISMLSVWNRISPWSRFSVLSLFIWPPVSCASPRAWSWNASHLQTEKVMPAECPACLSSLWSCKNWPLPCLRPGLWKMSHTPGPCFLLLYICLCWGPGSATQAHRTPTAAFSPAALSPQPREAVHSTGPSPLKPSPPQVCSPVLYCFPKQAPPNSPCCFSSPLSIHQNKFKEQTCQHRAAGGELRDWSWHIYTTVCKADS